MSLMNDAYFIGFLDQQAKQWDFASKQDAYVWSQLDDQTIANKALSKNWICLYPDAVGFLSDVTKRCALFDFNRNKEAVILGGWFQ